MNKFMNKVAPVIGVVLSTVAVFTTTNTASILWLGYEPAPKSLRK
jgi:hypothetical protein